jgi:hypothetical protein
MAGQQDECAKCGKKLVEPSGVRAPCPNCGSTERVVHASAHVTGTSSMSADAVVVRAWDGVSLALFGVIYGVVVTVLGVWIARLWWAWVLLYILGGLALLLFFLLVIPSM